MGGFTTFNAALVGFVEATRDDDPEKNRLCPPTPQPSQAVDWVSTVGGSLRALAVHASEPDLMAWIGRCRLSLTRGMAGMLEDPRLQPAAGRWAANAELAVRNAAVLLIQAASAGDRLTSEAQLQRTETVRATGRSGA